MAKQISFSKIIGLLLLVFLLAAFLNSVSSFAADEQKPALEQAPKTACTLEVEISGAIGPASLDLITRAEGRAQAAGCKSILLQINTPGGSLQTTRLIVEKILASEIPYLCLIAPAGAQAGSAGAIIMQACHVAGGLETTNIGAATPVSAGGEKMADDLRNKIMNDTRSWVESLAQLRGRNLEFAKDIVEKAKAVSSREAEKIKAIDWVGERKEDFLKFAATKKVQLNDKKQSEVQVGESLVFALDLRYKIMDLVTNPQIAYLMFMGSLGLLYFELTHPGAIVPGVVGGVGLVISLISLHMLDVTWGGVILILLGLALMVAEAFVASFGVLGAGGVIAFFLGSLFLFDMDVQGFDLPLMLILPTTFVVGLLMIGVAYLAFSTRKITRTGGFNDLVYHKGVISEVHEGGLEGQMQIEGEIWRFSSPVPLALGDEVLVTRHVGFTLHVIKKES
jgi:membrane-bound serine protease (ClpP class)